MEPATVIIKDLGSREIATRAIDRTLSIGKDPECDIRLFHSDLAPRHIQIEPDGGRYMLRSLNRSITRLNGRLVAPECTLASGDIISIPGYHLHIVDDRSAASAGRHTVELMRRYSQQLSRLHGDLLERMNLRGLSAMNLQPDLKSEEFQRRILELLDELIDQDAQPGGELTDFILLEALYGALMKELFQDQPEAHPGQVWVEPQIQEFKGFVQRCGQDVVRRRAKELGKTIGELTVSEQIEAVNRHFEVFFNDQEHNLGEDLRKHIVQTTIRNDLKALVLGLGPLQDLLQMPELSEIMVIGRSKIFVDKSGRLEETGRSFPNDENLDVVIKRIVDPVGRTVNISKPIVDARLPDGSRVNIVIKPVSLRGPAITIRKFRDRPFSVEELVANGTMSGQASRFLAACVRARKNIVVSGGTSSGKTTLLNTLSLAVPFHERIVVIEDNHELQLQHSNQVLLEARSANMEDEGEISIGRLVQTALRMRPDRIVVGECRGGEALDMLQAMNTGHDGSLTTAHANSPRELISRLEVMALMNKAGESLPIPAIHRQIAGAVDLIVQIQRLRNGNRRITHITEVVGYDPDEEQLDLQDIFCLSWSEGTAGSGEQASQELSFTGYIPSFIEELEGEGGISLQRLFLQDEEFGHHGGSP